MKVGTVVQLKREIMNSKPGSIGVVFNAYSGGVQVIFENGDYDGFSSASRSTCFGGQTEVEFFLSKIGFAPDLAHYQFTNVIRLENEFRGGRFDSVLSRRQYEIGAAV